MGDLIAGLTAGLEGNFTRVMIKGQVWVRHDVGSPEHQLSEARSAIADMTTEIDVLRSERDEALDYDPKGVIGEVLAEREKQRLAWLTDQDADRLGEVEILATANIFLRVSPSGSLDATRDRRADLIKSAAIIVAEIERRDRAALEKKGSV